MGKRRILIRLISAATVSLLMTGCFRYIDLSDRAIVQALGIDYEKGSYKVTFQYYHGDGSGGQSSIDVAKPNVITASGSGSSVFAAIEEAAFNSGEEPLYSENQLIVLGSGTTELPLSDVISYFITDYQSHPRVVLAVSDKKAEDVLKVKYKVGMVSTDTFKNILTNAEQSGFILNAPLYRVVSKLMSATGSVFLPLLTVEDTGSDATEDGKEVRIKGGMLYRDGMAAGKVGQLDSAGILIMSGEAKKSTISVQHESGNISAELYDISISTKPSVIDKKLIFTVEVGGNARLSESFISPDNTRKIEMLEKNISDTVKSRITSSIELVIGKYGADIFGLEKLVRHSEYELYEAVKDNWSETVGKCGFLVNANIKLTKFGLAE